MKIITFYADVALSGRPGENQAGFDWRQAIRYLSDSAARLGYETQVVTDEKTPMPGAWLRVGNASRDGLMAWLLQAQGAAMYACDGPSVLVSPDTLIAGPLDSLFGKWDLCLLTRKKPKPIINSVIAVRPSAPLVALWGEVAATVASLPAESREWGADIDAPVQVMHIQPSENTVRKVRGVRTRLMPLGGVFESVPRGTSPAPLKAALWDFKGPRKALMAGYARLLCS